MIARRPSNGRARLSDLMIWATFVASGVVLNKDGSLQTSYRFRGPDLASATEAGLAATMARVNNALRRLPTGWALHVEARRRVSDHYPDLIEEPPAAWLIDRERRAQYAETGTKLISEFFLTFSYLLPEDRTAKASKLLFENKPAGAERGMAEQIETFRETVRQVVDLLEPLFPVIEPLDDTATLTYLHDCISWSSVSIRPPDGVQLFDSFLYDTDLLPGLEPKLGDRWIKLLGIHGFPTTTMPALLGSAEQPAVCLSLDVALPVHGQDRCRR